MVMFSVIEIDFIILKIFNNQLSENKRFERKKMFWCIDRTVICMLLCLILELICKRVLSAIKFFKSNAKNCRHNILKVICDMIEGFGFYIFPRGYS